MEFVKKIRLSLITFICLFLLNCTTTRHTSLPDPAVADKANADSVSLKIMSYNVHHCNPPSKEKEGIIDIPAVAEVIRRQMPDLVALQEIDDHNERSGKDINEAEEMARILNMHFYFAKTIDYAGGGYGLAILSKYPLTETAVHFLPKDSSKRAEQRALLTTRVLLPNRRSIRFASTHLDIVSDSNRVMQMTEITNIAAKDSIPFIMGGDFNSRPNSKVIGLLDSFFQRSCTTSCDFTVPSGNPVVTIDYIAYKKDSPFHIQSHAVIPEAYASDHRPVVATFILR